MNRIKHFFSQDGGSSDREIFMDALTELPHGNIPVNSSENVWILMAELHFWTSLAQN